MPRQFNRVHESAGNAFLRTENQLYIVAHQIRNSSAFAGYKERKAAAAELKNIYTAAIPEEAEYQLEIFREKHEKRCGYILKS